MTGWEPFLDGEPDAGHPESVRALAGRYRVITADLHRRRRRALQARAVLDAQHGRAIAALSDRAAAIARVMGRLADDTASVADVLAHYADAVDDLTALAASCRSDAADATGRAERARFAVLSSSWSGASASTGWWDVPAEPVLSDPGPMYAVWTGAVADYREAHARYADLVARRDDLDRETAVRLDAHDPAARLGAPGGVHAPTAAALAALVGVATGDGTLVTGEGLAGLRDPAAVRALWDTLTQADRGRLVRDDARVVGNLDGVPLGVRAAANRHNIEAEITRLRAEVAGARADLSDAQTVPYGWELAANLRDRVETDTRTVAYYRSLLDAGTTWYDAQGRMHARPGSVVVTFDPAAHAIAIYHGGLDDDGDIPAWVREVGVYVPGTGTRMTRFGGTDGRTVDLYQAAHATRTRQPVPTSMIVWSGGDQPQLLDAALPRYSEDLGPELAAFVRSTPMPAGSDLTVMGHSYGGTTVAEAEKAGLSADRILYVSSAGLGHGVQSIAGFPNTADVPHYALMSRSDGIVGPIQGVEGFGLGHGASPLTADGVVRLETGYLHADDPSLGMVDDLSPSAAHSGVFTVGSTSFDNIVAVITGGDVVTYAPSRTEAVGGSVVTFDGDEAPGWDPDDFTVPVR